MVQMKCVRWGNKVVSLSRSICYGLRVFFRSKIYENRYNDNKILLQSDEKKMETVATTNSHLKAPVASVNCRQKVSACAKNSSIAPNIMSCVFILQANAEKNMQGGWIELKICMIPASFKASCFSIWPILISFSVSLRKTACDTKISLSIDFSQPTVLLLFAFLANVTQFLSFPLTFFCSTQKNAVINSWWDVSSE